MNDAVANVLVVGGVNAVAVAVLSILLKTAAQRFLERRDERYDQLKLEVTTLRDGRVAGIDTDLKDHKQHTAQAFGSAALSRKQIHRDMENDRRAFVTRTECQRQHGQVMKKVDELIGLGTDLATVSESLKHTATAVQKVAEKNESLAVDLARLEERSRKP